jgi:hypothetical protein
LRIRLLRPTRSRRSPNDAADRGGIHRSLARGAKQIYPYWLLGWNFTNGPKHNESILIGNQQFLFAMSTLGFDVPVPGAGRIQQWEERFMTSLDGYQALDRGLLKVDHCEPRQPRFRRAPRLCRKWWDPSHTAICGDR